MARTLNNEVDVLNIASLDNDIKDSFTRAMITEDVNTTSAAARRYLEGEYFIHTDRYLYKALEDIAAGTTITPDVNAEVVTVSEELVRLFAQSPEGIFEILSNIENTSVASKNYVKGSQFIWTDKKLYEATADINSGSTFVVGTNIKLADNLTSQIQTLTNNDDAILNELGAKNLLSNTSTSQTINGVTFTVNSNGSIRAVRTTTTTSPATLVINSNWNKSLIKDKEYILTGCPDGGSNSTYKIKLVADDNEKAIQDFGSGGTSFVLDDTIISTTNTHEAQIVVYAGGPLDLTFYPMIRPASIADDTYVHYAMTNRELTQTLAKTIGLQPIIMTYKEVNFTNGYGEYDFSADLVSYGYTKLAMGIAQVCSAVAGASYPVVRSCDTSGSKLKIALTNAGVSQKIGIFFALRLTN